MTDLDLSLPLGSGEWTAALVDRPTGAELLLEDSAWRGAAARAVNAVSEATVLLDPEYAARINRRPGLWLNEVHLYRDGLLAWVGPVVSIDDDETNGVVWNCQDRMAIPTERRWFWSSQTYAGDITSLMATALEHADLGDPTGLILDGVPTGVISDMTVIAGDKVGEVIRGLGISWTVVADVLRFGDIYTDTGVLLEAGAWGQDRPTIEADGFQRLTHVCAVCTNGARVFYPSPDPDDRLPGSPILVDTIDVGDVSARAARELARAAWTSRQGELSIIPEDARPVGPEFPLTWPYLVPGLTMIASSEGAQLTADEVPVKLTEVAAEFADGQETSVTVAIDEAPQSDLIDPFLVRVVETRLASVFPPGQSYPGVHPAPGVDWESIGLDPDVDVLPPDDGTDWESIAPLSGSGLGSVIAPLPDPVYEPISWAGAEIPTAAGVDLFPDPADPFADCPPAYCCDQCAGTGTDPGAVEDNNIWLSLDLGAGDTTWTSKAGDERTILGQGTESMADGGYVLSPSGVLAGFGTKIYPTGDPGFSWDETGGDITYIIEATNWWVNPRGITEHNQMQGGSEVFLFSAMEDFSPGRPTNWGIGSIGTVIDGTHIIDVESSSVGADDYSRLFVRVVFTPTTAAVVVDLSTDGVTWTNQGSATWSSLFTNPNAGINVAWDNSVDSTSDGLAPTIIHSVYMEQDGTSFAFTAAQLEAEPLTWTVDTNEDSTITLGNLDLVRTGVAGTVANVVRGGAPLYCHWVGGIQDSTAEPIFGGADLADPAIAVAWAEDPSHIQIITGVQPSAFNGVDSSYGSAQATQHALVYGVCDRATFTDIGANGWPTDWWPFGTKTAV